MGSYDVCVLGLGLLGGGVARRFADTGSAVVGWNRSPAKAEPLSDAVAFEPDPRQAVRSAPLSVWVLADYAVSHEVLEAVGPLDGRAVAQMATGSADDARAFAAAVERAGGRPLDVVMFSFPQTLGQP